MIHLRFLFVHCNNYLKIYYVLYLLSHNRSVLLFAVNIRCIKEHSRLKYYVSHRTRSSIAGNKYVKYGLQNIYTNSLTCLINIVIVVYVLRKVHTNNLLVQAFNRNYVIRWSIHYRKTCNFYYKSASWELNL